MNTDPQNGLRLVVLDSSLGWTGSFEILAKTLDSHEVLKLQTQDLTPNSHVSSVTMINRMMGTKKCTFNFLYLLFCHKLYNHSISHCCHQFFPPLPPLFPTAATIFIIFSQCIRLLIYMVRNLGLVALDYMRLCPCQNQYHGFIAIMNMQKYQI